tara:strand:- start:665 stop:2776 length:2112 start_codon:yes stop_codon:yes gene_type:complete
MALMDKPLPEDAVDTSLAMSVEEDGNAEEQNIELSNTVAYIKSQYERAKDARLSDEDRWLDAYRNYRGVYSSEVQFTETEKSKAFIKVTKTKVLAAYAQVVDVLFAGSKFPIGIEARKYPNNVEDKVTFNPNRLTTEKVKEQANLDYNVPYNIARPDIAKDLGIYKDKLGPIEDELEVDTSNIQGSMVFEPAKVAAQRMEKLMHDQLDETEAPKHLRSVAFETCLFGTGVMKGPFAHSKEYPRWNEDGEYSPIMETIPKMEYVSIWDFYPDPDARNMSEAEFTIQRHRLNRTQLRSLKKRPHFRDESIELAIDYGADYYRSYWEDALEEDSVSEQMDRFEVLEYWGVLDNELAEEADLELPDELADQDQVQVNIWVCNGQILRLVLNPFTPSRIPYLAVPYELNPYSFFGIGVAENMTDTQLLMNGFMRMAVDNGALSGNLLIEVDETNLVPGQDLQVYPGKVFRRQAGAPGQAIFGTKFPNVSQELLMMFDKSRQLADEATGIPSYSHGSGAVGGVGRTASGMSMLMGAAAQNIKAVVRNIDDYLLGPLGKSLFAFNMQFNFDPEFVGDLDVKARGTESLMRNEVRSQRLLQFMQMTANPQMAPFVKYDFILRELASSMDLDEDKILNDPREAAIQQKMMAEIQAMMPQQPQPPTPPVPEGAGTPQAPTPDTQGFTGSGGGANGGNAPQPDQPPPTANEVIQ